MIKIVFRMSCYLGHTTSGYTLDDKLKNVIFFHTKQEQGSNDTSLSRTIDY